MIGKITLRNGKEVVLGDDRKWHCDDELLERHLELLYNFAENYSPADGEPGAGLLAEAARALKGKAEYLRKVEDSPPGKVF